MRRKKKTCGGKKKYSIGGAFLNHNVVRKEFEWRMGKNEDSWNAGRNAKMGTLKTGQGIGGSSHLLALNLAAKNSECKN